MHNFMLPFIWSTKILHAGGCVQIEKNKNKLTPFQPNAHSSMKNSEHMAGFYWEPLYSASIKMICKVCNFLNFRNMIL